MSAAASIRDDTPRCLLNGPGHGTYWKGVLHLRAHPGPAHMVLSVDQVSEDGWITFTALGHGEEIQVRGWSHSADLLRSRLRWLPERQFLTWENDSYTTCISLCLDTPEPCRFPAVPRRPPALQVSPPQRRRLGHGPGRPADEDNRQW
ncbi:hypothetical protein [Streptomyces sp. MS1.AVA.4]|uniref:Uncharacterized protein n=1 Tax=Streptomyces pratisoli TaxID=3139917 RepID=A0ACC6QRU3_9ACTN